MTKKYNQGVADSNRRRARHGEWETKTHQMWRSIKYRCTNPSAQHYDRYGGRGITMHPAWVGSYEQFRDDVGHPPSDKYTLDRIDNNKGYEPTNVRWATRKEQANNRETNVVVEWEGVSRTLAEWADHMKVKYGLLGSRWKKGLRGADLFAPPQYTRGATIEFNGESKTLPEWVKATGVNYQTLRWRHQNGKPLFEDKDLL